MKIIEESRQATTDVPDAGALVAEALIKEARRHRRRRHLAYVAVAIVVIAGVVVAVVANRRPAHNVTAPPNEPKVGGPPVGRVVSLKLAGPLAVGPDGALYVVDEERHEVLVRQTNGQFRVVAGDGRNGFSGDGGPATKVALSNVSDITFAPDGDLYMADGGRVRVVNTAGIITTIAGDGHSGIVANGTPALSAPLAPVNFLSIAFGPNGELYISTGNQLLRLSAGKLATVRAVVTAGPLKGVLDRNLGQLAVDAHGDIYVSGFNGWSIWRVTPNGVATEIGTPPDARQSGGSTSVLELGPRGAVYAEGGPTILRIDGDRLNRSYTFTTVPGGQYFWLTYFAFGPGGALYADEVPGDVGFEAHQQLVSVAGGHVSLRWQEKNHVAS